MTSQGWTKTPNDWLEELATIADAKTAILLIVRRMTTGWRRSTWAVTIRELSEAINKTRKTTTRAVKWLVAKRRLYRLGRQLSLAPIAVQQTEPDLIPDATREGGDKNVPLRGSRMSQGDPVQQSDQRKEDKRKADDQAKGQGELVETITVQLGDRPEVKAMMANPVIDHDDPIAAAGLGLVNDDDLQEVTPIRNQKWWASNHGATAVPPDERVDPNDLRSLLDNAGIDVYDRQQLMWIRHWWRLAAIVAAIKAAVDRKGKPSERVFAFHRELGDTAAETSAPRRACYEPFKPPTRNEALEEATDRAFHAEQDAIEARQIAELDAAKERAEADRETVRAAARAATGVLSGLMPKRARLTIDDLRRRRAECSDGE